MAPIGTFGESTIGVCVQVRVLRAERLVARYPRAYSRGTLPYTIGRARTICQAQSRDRAEQQSKHTHAHALQVVHEAQMGQD